jgi:hypothetical protein
MSRRPIATVRVLTLPHIADGCVRIEVECRYSTTGLTSIPGPAIALTRPQMVTAAVFEHEQRCGDCDTGAAHRQGDTRLRDQTARAWAAMQVEQARRDAEARRN